MAKHDAFAVRRLLSRINHAPTSYAVTAERALLAGTAAHAICGALATIDHGVLTLRAVAANEHGHIRARDMITGPQEHAAELGQQLASMIVQTLAREHVA